MPAVLITRPKAMSEALAATLQGLGYVTAIEPLLSIVPLPTLRPQTGTVDAVMITSSNTLFALKKRQSEIADLFDIFCYCVGPRTAETARAFGFRQVHAATGDSAELAGLINLSYQKKNVSILHIAARDVNDTARTRTLAKRPSRDRLAGLRVHSDEKTNAGHTQCYCAPKTRCRDDFLAKDGTRVERGFLIDSKL